MARCESHNTIDEPWGVFVVVRIGHSCALEIPICKCIFLVTWDDMMEVRDGLLSPELCSQRTTFKSSMLCRVLWDNEGRLVEGPRAASVVVVDESWVGESPSIGRLISESPETVKFRVNRKSHHLVFDLLRF